MEALREGLLNASYQPQNIRAVCIPKPNGRKRTLGIPTVVDRLVQQADPHFSEKSFGFRPNRSTHQALKKARSYVDAGYNKVVDIDIEKFFDKVKHDILLSRLARRIGDKRLLLIIRRRKFLGYRIVKGQFQIAPESIERVSDKLRAFTKRRSPQTLEARAEKLNQLIRGWVNYFTLANAREYLKELDQWLRRRIRCLRLHQLKRTFSKVEFLKSLGVSAKVAWMTMLSGKGNWRPANSAAAHIAMNLKCFEDLGLLSLESQ